MLYPKLSFLATGGCCRGWFVSCIMLYYICIYFIGSYIKDKAFIFSIIVLIISAIWFYSVYRTPEFTNIYDDDVYPIRWLMFFVFMLLGAKLGSQENTQKSKPIMDCILLIICLVGFYSIYISTMRIDSIRGFQFLNVFPLLGAVYYFYKVSSSDWANMIYNSKTGYVFIRLIGGLCLEIYLIQHFLFTDKMNNIFPLNIPIMFAIIVFAAYITRCFARFISQTFKDEPYNWEKIVNWL